MAAQPPVAPYPSARPVAQAHVLRRPAPAQLAPGAMLNNPWTGTAYFIDRILGQGSFGSAYLARTEAFSVVIKVQSIVKHQFAITETQLIETLRHRNIVRHLDSWRSETESVIVMEFCERGDLRALIRRRTRAKTTIPEPQIRLWFIQMTLALHYCHAQHIIHRDIKAENVLLCGETAKIADFGLARSLQDTMDFASTRVGTPHYIPPEVLDNWPYNVRADMWCLGIILYELITLRRPFRGNDSQEVLDSVRHDTPTPARELSNDRYSPELYELCDTLMSRDPTQRPVTGEILDRPWAAQYIPCGLDIDTESMRERERQAWARISHPAIHPKEQSNLYQHALRQTAINVRRTPDRASEVLSRLNYGDIAEVLGEVKNAAGDVYLKLVEGYCIRDDPQRPGKLSMRRLPEWRVIRPGAPAGYAASESPSTRSTINEASEKEVQELLSKEFYSSESRVHALLDFVSRQGIPDAILNDLIADYEHLSNPDDDAAWTFNCIAVLRPLRCVHCVRVIRLMIHEMNLEEERVAQLGRREADLDAREAVQAPQLT